MAINRLLSSRIIRSAICSFCYSCLSHSFRQCQVRNPHWTVKPSTYWNVAWLSCLKRQKICPQPWASNVLVSDQRLKENNEMPAEQTEWTLAINSFMDLRTKGPTTFSSSAHICPVYRFQSCGWIPLCLPPWCHVFWWLFLLALPAVSKSESLRSIWQQSSGHNSYPITDVGPVEDVVFFTVCRCYSHSCLVVPPFRCWYLILFHEIP